MGWGRYFFLGDWGQQMDIAEQGNQIDDQERRIRNMKAKLAERNETIDSTQASVVKLQAENDELKLYLAAVIRILLDKKLTTERDIQRLVDLIDAEDGTADGRLRGNLV